MGALEVSDSVGLDTALKIGRQMAEAMQQDHSKDPRGALLAWLVEDKGRVGRKGGKGFYEYGDDGKPTRIWPDLSQKIEVKVKECPPALKEELTKRFLFRQCIEVARCFEEGVITDPRDADVGSILAWGFAPYTGGCVSYIDLCSGARRSSWKKPIVSPTRTANASARTSSCATWPPRARPSTSASAPSRRPKLSFHRIGSGRAVKRALFFAPCSRHAIALSSWRYA
jgi:hypothetical protein